MNVKGESAAMERTPAEGAGRWSMEYRGSSVVANRLHRLVPCSAGVSKLVLPQALGDGGGGWQPTQAPSSLLPQREGRS